MKSIPFLKAVTRCREDMETVSVCHLHDSLRLSLSCNLLRTLEQSIVDIFGAGDLRLDHAEVLGVRHGLRLHCVWLGGCRDQVGRVFGAVNALRKALVRQPLHTGEKTLEMCMVHF